MGEQRKPLLTEEQIQEMLEFVHPAYSDSPKEHQAFRWVSDNHFILWRHCIERKCTPLRSGMDTFLAFLRGKTKRVLNLDRLRKDVKAWVDDPDRKWPEYLVSLLDFDHRQDLASDSSDLMDDQIQLCMFAATIGINPDDYFEEVIVEEEV